LFRRERSEAAATPERKTFTADETRAYVDGFADTVVAPGLTARDLFDKHVTWHRLVQQFEGLADDWHYGGRIVLVGDAAVQMTSAAGMGLNCGLQNAVALANAVDGLLRREQGGNPSAEALDAAFAEYQAVRQGESRAVVDMSKQVLSGNTWDGWSAWLFAEYMVPYVFGLRKLIDMASNQIVSKGRVLDCVDKESRSGKVPWAN
jgi:2-polyprenyl-6-methoxyphenol hydroxylase-like FAD-dependent oxidoreductase